MSILLGSLADDISAALTAAGVPYELTVSRTVTTGDPWDPTITTTNYACQGWRDEWTLDELASTLISVTDLKFVILGTSLAIAPTTADRVIVDGVSHAIVSVHRDPAGATFTLQARA